MPRYPRDCFRRSPSPWPRACGSSLAGEAVVKRCPPSRRSARPPSSAPTRPAALPRTACGWFAVWTSHGERLSNDPAPRRRGRTHPRCRARGPHRRGTWPLHSHQHRRSNGAEEERIVSSPDAERFVGANNQRRADLLAAQRGRCSRTWAAALTPCTRPHDSTTAAEWEPAVRSRKPAHAVGHASASAADNVP